MTAAAPGEARRPVTATKATRLLVISLSWVGLLWTGWLFLILNQTHSGWGYDAYAYWSVDLDDVYGRSFGQLTEHGAFRYAPPLAFLLAPAGLLTWPAFLALWTAIGFGLLAWGAGRYTLAVLAYPGVAVSLYAGNIDVFLGVAVLNPAILAVAILAKPTMAVWLLWFVVRREWRPLVVVVGVGFALAIPTLVLAPEMWREWFAMLADNSAVATGQEFGPLWLRLPLAALAIVWAARADRPWVAGLALAIAQPAFGLRSATVGLVAAVALWRRKAAHDTRA